ncbi:MAG: hypothetical protein K9N46_05550 [Candidatus Marinimicrobia bacterium]|nr:hypothetical protein [Candidatus Neomarinimicrobiota bacterium]MCF7880188.1 hypothetical protein [Candidatus Neomarinimicrobiota bacterium]
MQPEFFFTTSFLYNFFKQADEDKEINGKLNSHQQEFVYFFESRTGYVLNDGRMKDLMTLAIPRKVIGQPSNPPYRPMDNKSQDTSNRYINTQKEAITNCFAAFSDSFSPAVCNSYRSQYFTPIFSSKEVQENWAKYSGKHSVDIVKDKFYQWTDILAIFDLPSNAIIISDRYIGSDQEKIKNNIIPILEHFSEISTQTVPVIILSSSKAAQERQVYGSSEFNDLTEYQTYLEEWLNREFEDRLKVTFLFLPKRKIKHDRRIFTKFCLLNIPKGLDILNAQGQALEDTEPSIRSVFHAEIKKSQNFLRLKSDVLEVVNASDTLSITI